MGRLLYVVPATIIALILVNPNNYESVAFLSLLSSSVLFFLGYPNQAFLTLLSGILGIGTVKVLSIDSTETITRTKRVTVTSAETVTVYLTETLTRTVTRTLIKESTVTETSFLTLRDCSREVIVTSFVNLGEIACYGKLFCEGSKEVNAMLGYNLTVTSRVIGTTTVYLPINGTIGPCVNGISVKPGVTFVLARPYYGQVPATVTIRMKTESR